MKVLAKLNNLLVGQNGQGYLTLRVNSFRHVAMLNELEEEKTYSVEIKEIKSQRTIQQNNYLWALIHDIDVAINGKPTDEMDIYAMLLERASAKFDYIGALEVTEPMLKKNFRAIKKIKEIDLNGVQGYMYKVFIGSSKMNTKEMKQLIDTALDVAGELGLDMDYWNGVLR